MIIYNKRTRNFILKKILEKEFQRKYNWKIIQKDSKLELIPATNLQKFVIFFENNLLSIESKFIYLKKKLRNIYIYEIITKLYRLYFQSIIIEYLLENYQESMKTLYIQSFLHLSTYDLKVIREIF